MFRTFVLTLTAAATLSAQPALDQTLVFTGTTATVGAETFSWLVWQPSDPLLLVGRNVAIYRKAGSAASVSAFSRISVLEPSADTRLIQSLLPVSQKLGQNLAELDGLLTEMLKDAMPAGAVTTADKISALLVGAHGNAANMQRVILFGRQHPAIAMCGGFGLADKISAAGVRTYELREFDLASGADIGVLGRVTIDPAAVLVLPAPGRPFEVADESVKGNINISMRWETPNALRDLAPLHYGYDVYRVPKATVLARGWDVTPPGSVATLLTGAGVAKVNRLAVLPPALLDAAAATNSADTTTVFLNDDNSRFDGGTDFNDGQEFGWFAVARDLLGRGGVPSPVMLSMIKNRMPPNPPQHVEVKNLSTYNGTVRDQRFTITWDAPELPVGKTLLAYAVYRWRTPADIAKNGRHLDPVTNRPDANLIAIVPAAPTAHSFTDDGSTMAPPWAEIDLPPPSVPTDLGKTFYYTVRAIDNTVAQNLSGHSAPAWGVLRDREGPAGAYGGLNLRCYNPALTFTELTQVDKTGLTDDQGHFIFTCLSTLPSGLDWAEFRIVKAGGQPVELGRAYFEKNGAGNLVAALLKTMPDYLNGDAPVAFCRVGTKGGVISGWVPSTILPVPQNDKFILTTWNVALNGLAVDGLLCGWKHEAVDPPSGGTTDVSGTFTPTPGSKEWKVYRRVDNSAQTLIASGTVPGAAPITWTDPSPPASNGTLCYFLQLFDEHGNAGPLVQQGECVESGDTTYMPIPMLEPITGTTPLNPRMRVSWFCNTAGVQRFEVWVARASGSAPLNTNSGLSNDLANVHPNELSLLDDAKGLDFFVFETGIARNLNAGGEPHFSFTLPVSSSDDYTVLVRAVGVGSWGTRIAGAWSNVGTFSFALRTVGLDIPVPWPDRPLPPKADFHDGIASIHIGGPALSPWKGNAVRIGEYEDSGQGTIISPSTDNNPSAPRIFGIPTVRDLENYLYTNDLVAQAEPLEEIPGVILPVALYRVQVTNAKYPFVPGDIVQVSPLMEQVAQIDDAGSNVVTDPFIAILPGSLTGLPRTIPGSDQDILLLDRQPVLKGARYKYLVVRFSPTKEIERVIATNPVDVP